jgi:predicted enzyme related to lactoylglutathione lyase
MARVTGLGGFFFKSSDPKGLAAWYQKHLGLPITDFGGAMFAEDEKRAGVTLWTPFKADTNYFQPSTKDFMINFRVDDLDGLLAQLRSEGVQVDENVQDSEYGKFGWIMDPEGNRVELWQPPAA